MHLDFQQISKEDLLQNKLFPVSHCLLLRTYHSSHFTLIGYLLIFIVTLRFFLLFSRYSLRLENLCHIASDFAPFQGIPNPLFPVKYEKTIFNPEQTIITPLFFLINTPKVSHEQKEREHHFCKSPELVKEITLK